MEERNTRGVECLIVDKVYDGCSKKECMQNMPFELELNGDLSDYTFLYAQFGASEIEHYECEPFFTEISLFMQYLEENAIAVLLRYLQNQCAEIPFNQIIKLEYL